MAKSLRKLQDATASESMPAGSITEAQSGDGSALSEKPAAAKPAKVATKSKSKRAPEATLKTGPTTKPRRPTAAKKTTRRPAKVSDDDIRLRAYFISQQRAQDGIAGDSASDWLEAKRQVLAEASDRA